MIKEILSFLEDSFSVLLLSTMGSYIGVRTMNERRKNEKLRKEYYEGKNK